MEDGELRPWSRPRRNGVLRAEQVSRVSEVAPVRGPILVRAAGRKRVPVQQGPSLGWDSFLDRVRTHTLCLSGMAFQDADARPGAPPRLLHPYRQPRRTADPVLRL